MTSADPRLQLSLRGRLGALELAIALDLPPGLHVLIGPNGAGKSTVLRTIAGAESRFSGRCLFGDACLWDSERGHFVPPERRHVGYLPQSVALFPHLSGGDNVRFGTPPSSFAQEAKPAGPLRWLSSLGAEHVATLRPDRMSGGEQQRVGLARTLAREPRLLLLDEPFAALDVVSRAAVRSVVADYVKARALTAILVTHDVRDALAIGDSCVVLEAGQVSYRGPARHAVQPSSTPFVRAFFAGVDAPA